MKVVIELEFENKDEITEADVYNYLHELLADDSLSYEIIEED